MINEIVNSAIAKSVTKAVGDNSFGDSTKACFKNYLRDFSNERLHSLYQERDNPELGLLYEVILATQELFYNREKITNMDYWGERFCVQAVGSMETDIIQDVGSEIVALFILACEKNGYTLGMFSVFGAVLS